MSMTTGKEKKIEFDSSTDTLKHIKRVNQLLLIVCNELLKRATNHDASKLEAPEKALFDEYTPKLASVTYGSEEYKELLKGLQVGLDHHYANNSHHPEHYSNGVNDMNLFDIIEMLVDWKAASERHNDGDFMKSIDINEKRFVLSPQLKSILANTANYFKDSK